MTTATLKPQKARVTSKETKQKKKKSKDTIIDFIKRSLNGKGEARLAFREISSATGFSDITVQRAVKHMRENLNAVWHIESGIGQKGGSPTITLFKRL